MSKPSFVLKKSNEFSKLILPLSPRKHSELTYNLVTKGCNEPIATWNGFILSDYEKYEICRENDIPFAISQKFFLCVEQAAAWICVEQLKRDDLTEEMRKYLIGTRYKSEVAANLKINIDEITNVPLRPSRRQNGTAQVRNKSHATAEAFAKEYHVSRQTVQKYGAYSLLIDELASKNPDIATNMLAGKRKVSFTDLERLAKMEPTQIRKIVKRISQSQNPTSKYVETREIIAKEAKRTGAPYEPSKITVKDMPQFDPDAELIGLALTVPTWTSSIVRVTENTNFSMISESARNRIEKAVCDLDDSISRLLEEMER